MLNCHCQGHYGVVHDAAAATDCLSSALQGLDPSTETWSELESSAGNRKPDRNLGGPANSTTDRDAVFHSESSNFGMVGTVGNGSVLYTCGGYDQPNSLATSACSQCILEDAHLPATTNLPHSIVAACYGSDGTRFAVAGGYEALDNGIENVEYLDTVLGLD